MPPPIQQTDDECSSGGVAPSRTAAITRLIEILESARARKHMYFSPIEPNAAEHWLSGLETGCTLAGLQWSPEERRPALAKRGLELLSTWESRQLADRGLSPEAIVDELLAIEIEMWRRIGGIDT